VTTSTADDVVSLMIHLGDRLGIYRALDGVGPVTAEALAARTATIRPGMRSGGPAATLPGGD